MMASVPTQPILIPANGRIEFAMISIAWAFTLMRKKATSNPINLGNTWGLFLTSSKGNSVSSWKTDKLLLLIGEILDSSNLVAARVVSRLTSTLISMELALGPVAHLRTRSLYADLNSVANLSSKISLSHEAIYCQRKLV